MQKNNFLRETQAAFFAYRRILGLEQKKRGKVTLYIEEEFLEMFPPQSLSNVTNQALNDYAVKVGLVVAVPDEPGPSLYDNQGGKPPGAPRDF